MDKETADSMRHKADILTSEGRSDEAIPLYQKLVEGEPDDDSHLLSLAWALKDTGQNSQAIGCFEQLFNRELKRSILTGFGYDELVRIYREEKNWDALIRVCRRAAERRNDDAGFLQTLAEAYLDAGRTSEAIDVFKKLISLDREAPEFWCSFGKALIATGNIEEGENAYKKAMEIDPSSAVTYFDRLGKLLLDRGYPQKAKEAWERCITLVPGEPFYYMGIGESLVCLNEISSAMDAFAHAALMNSQRGGDYWSRLGEILIKKGLYNDAAAAYVQAIASEPDNTRFRLRLASCYASSGENNLAAKTLKGIKMLEGRKR